MGSELREACGVFAVVGHPDAWPLGYAGLLSLQHRGQESAGVAWVALDDIQVAKGMGLVTEVLGRRPVPDPPPDVLVGHVRYSTAGGSVPENAQPLVARTRFGPVALAHNGNLVNYRVLREALAKDGAVFQTTSDTEVLAHLIARAQAGTLADAVEAAARRLEGGFAYVLLTRDGVMGLRDPHGLRPLVLGRLAGAWMLASETCALDAVGATTVREVDPGELVVVTGGRVESRHPWGAATLPAVCAFEEVYFARPDSRMGGRTVHDTRRALGAELAREAPAEADVVVGVPDSSIPAAIGYAEAIGIPFDMGLVKNRYVGRSFIQPGQAARDTTVVQKLAAVDSVVAGRRVVLVDDSLVRGTTARHLTQLLRQAGARAVHMRIASPPYIRTCHYGIDTSRSDELAAARHDLETIRRLSGADSLQYLSMAGLLRALGRDGWCLACFGGPYPVPVDQDVVHHVP